MSESTINDAKATVRMALLEAIVMTNHATGLRADDATDLLLDALIDAIQRQPTRWAFEMLASGREPKHEYTGTLCAACGKPQFLTRSGEVCENGHDCKRCGKVEKRDRSDGEEV